MALKNRVGTRAADFCYIMASEKQMSLYATSADNLLLFFYNPECGNCREVMNGIRTSAVIGREMKSGKLKVLAVYVDEDIEVWRKHLPDIPAGWINGYDPGQTLTNTQRYDLKATPTLYLLGPQKEVLLKDPSFQQVEAWFTSTLLPHPSV